MLQCGAFTVHMCIFITAGTAPQSSASSTSLVSTSDNVSHHDTLQPINVLQLEVIGSVLRIVMDFFAKESLYIDR